MGVPDSVLFLLALWKCVNQVLNRSCLGDFAVFVIADSFAKFHVDKDALRLKDFKVLFRYHVVDSDSSCDF